MQMDSILSGGGPVMKKYMAGTTMATAGIPVLGAVDAATDLGSIEPMTAGGVTGIGSMVGLLLDITGTVAATGITDSAELFSRVIVNPDLVYKARASGSTTVGTALANTTTNAASSDGTVATGTTTFDNGALYGETGGNVNDVRRTDDVSGSVSINFPNAIASGDTFVAVHGFPCSVELTDFECYDLTTDLTEIDAQALTTDANNFSTLDIEFNENEPLLKTHYLLIANNHLFGSSSLA